MNAGFVFWFLSLFLWNKVLTTTSPPSAGTQLASTNQYNPTLFTTVPYLYTVATLSSGTSPPAACFISLDGKKGTFGDKLTLETSSGPAEVPTSSTTSPITLPTSSVTSTPTTTPTATSTCIQYKQWKIAVPKGHYVEMTLESIHLGPGACLYEMYVIVKDGHSESSNVLHIQCEPDSTPRRIWSSGNEMLVERYGSSSRSSANTGFKARFEAKLLTNGDAPKFQSLVENVTLIWGYPSNLLCQAQAAPAPEITWYKNASMLQNSTSVIFKTTLYSKPEKYTCEARNSFGSEKKEFLVTTQKCSRFCRCSVLKSDPFWIGVDCAKTWYPYIVPNDIPHVAKYLVFVVSAGVNNCLHTRHFEQREMPLPLFLGALVHSRTRSKDLVDTLYRLGLSVSYERVLGLSADLGNYAISHFETDGTVCQSTLSIGLARPYSYTLALFATVTKNKPPVPEVCGLKQSSCSLMNNECSNPVDVVRNIWEESFVEMLSGQHNKMALLKARGDFSDGSNWMSALVKAEIATVGTSNSFLKAVHVKETAIAHQIIACALYRLRQASYVEWPECSGTSFEEWCEQRAL
ncbi:uncharacterized protein LOC144640099 [Oculina patagonica]